MGREEISKLTDCSLSMGVDGSSAKIDKAKKIDQEETIRLVNYQIGLLWKR